MSLQSRIVSRIVKVELEKDTLVVLAMINRISNSRKVARRLLPSIAKELGYEPKLGSVAKVVERYVNEVEESGKLAGLDVDGLKKMLAKTQVTLRSDVAIASVRVTRGIGKKLVKIMDYVYSKTEVPFLSITYGKSYITLLFDQQHCDKILKIVGKKNIVYAKKNHATLSITNPPDVIGVPGFAGHVFSILGMNGINIVEMLSSYNEGIMVLNEKDANKAYAVLRAEIDRMRRHVR